MRRAIIIVLDSFGIGHLPDAKNFGDVGSNTLGHIDEYAHKNNLSFKIPNLLVYLFLSLLKGGRII